MSEFSPYVVVLVLAAVLFYPLLLLTVFIEIKIIDLLGRFKPRPPELGCPVCGYDIRHSPHRCPECGSILRWGFLARWKDL